MNENVNANPYAEVYRKIGYYRANSKDTNFHIYLDKKLYEAERGLVSPQDLIRDLDVNYKRYLEAVKNYTQVNNVNQPVVNPATMQTPVTDSIRSVAPVKTAEDIENEKQKRKELEYKIGAGVLSIIGVIFILVSLLYFGKTFLNDLFQAVLIYAVGGIVILASEIVLEKKMPRLAHVITGLGFGFLYFATLFSFMYLHVFNYIVTGIVLVAVALLNLLLARIRKSQVMEVVTSIGSCLAVLSFQGKPSTTEFALVSGLMLFVNVLLFVDKYREGERISKISRLSIVFVSSLYILISSIFNNVNDLARNIFALAAVFAILMSVVFNREDMVHKIVSLSFSGLLMLFIIPGGIELKADSFIVLGVLLLACGIPFLLMLKEKEKWICYSLFIISLTCLFVATDNETLAILGALVCLIISKALISVEELPYVDATVTMLALLTAVGHYEKPLGFLILLVAVVGTVMCDRFRIFHEFAVSIYSCIYVMLILEDNFLRIPILMALILAFLFLFNLMPGMQVEGIKYYNTISMTVLGIVSMFSPAFRVDSQWQNIVSSVICIILGMVAIIVFLRDRFHMETKFRYLIFGVFLTYMALFIDVDGLWISISLMAVAFIMIALGCIVNRFETRIYGLILSLLVCVKVAFYDFGGEANFQRMIVFLVVGILAIAISFTYLLLEKHEQKNKLTEETPSEQTEEKENN